MIGLALILIPAGYVLAYTGFAGDGSAKAGAKKSYSLSVAFANALQGSFVHPQGIAG
jgi:hypothetical protein